MNYMEMVADMLGLELGEEFKVSDSAIRYRLVDEGLMYYDTVNKDWEDDADSTLEDILSGGVKIVKKPWIPKGDNRWYCVWIECDERRIKTRVRVNGSDLICSAFLALGNCFRTQAEAEAQKNEVTERIQKIMDGKLRVEFVEVERNEHDTSGYIVHGTNGRL